MSQHLILNGVSKAISDFFADETNLGVGNTQTENIHWPNNNIDTAQKDLWFSFNDFPSEPFVASQGEGGIDRHTGFFQINIHVKENSGDSVIRWWHEKLREYFKTWSEYDYQGLKIKFPSSFLTNGRHYENFYVKTFQVSYECDITRTN